METGSFTMTADKLGYTQSGVSHIIQNMENEFRLPLFIRDNRKVIPTSAALEIIPMIKDMICSEDNILQTVDGLLGLYRGTIRVAAGIFPMIRWMPRIIKEFNQKYPDIQIHLVDGNYEKIETMLIAGELDMGFLSLPTKENLETIPLYEERLMVVLPKGHPLAAKPILSLAEISGEPFIIPGESSRSHVGEFCARHGCTLPKAYSSPVDYVTISLVKEGLGLSIVPELILRDFADDVEARYLLEEDAVRTLGVALLSLSKCSPATGKFLELIKQAFSSENIFHMLFYK
jgi:DNA-binding transcriptional LysR family regulator